MPATPIRMMCKVTVLFLFGFLELRGECLLRRDLRRIKVSLSAWNRPHKDNIRAALMPSRGASTIKKKQSGMAREMFSGTCIP
eukprot:1142783-Pelagomonas_calceolata.AAC.3